MIFSHIQGVGVPDGPGPGLRLAVGRDPDWTAAALTARLTCMAESMAGWLGRVG